MDDTTTDLTVNLDKFYWRDNNTIMREEASTVLPVVIQNTSMKPSYILGTMYQVEPTVIQHDSE